MTLKINMTIKASMTATEAAQHTLADTDWGKEIEMGKSDFFWCSEATPPPELQGKNQTFLIDDSLENINWFLDWTWNQRRLVIKLIEFNYCQIALCSQNSIDRYWSTSHKLKIKIILKSFCSISTARIVKIT